MTQIQVHSYKHDGTAHWRYAAELRSNDGVFLTFSAAGTPYVNMKRTGDAAEDWLGYFRPDRWYNVIRYPANDKHGPGWYCNIAAPAIFDGAVLSYVDYDLDIEVSETADGLTWELLDEDEFEAAIADYGYDDALIQRCREAVQDLIALVESRAFPFD